MTQTGTGELDYSAHALNNLLPIFKDAPPVYIPVRFGERFNNVPTVMLGLSGFKGGGEGFKFKVDPHKITEAGFEIMLRTNRNWIDLIRVSWIAIDA